VLNTSNGSETRNANLVLAVKDYIKNKPLGTLIKHDELVDIIGAKKRYYYEIVGRAKRELIRLGVFLDSVHKEGYKVVNPGDEINICVARTLKAYRLEIRAAHDSLHIKTENIADADSRERTEKLTQQMTARLPFTDNQMRLLEMVATGGDK
jgi:hypothetical protein